MTIQENLSVALKPNSLTLQDWVATLPVEDRAAFAAAEIRRQALVDAAVNSGALIVDLDDRAALAALAAVVETIRSTLPLNLSDAEKEAALMADPTVIAQAAAVAAAKATPMYQWKDNASRDAMPTQDPTWLAFWDRWVAATQV